MYFISTIITVYVVGSSVSQLFGWVSFVAALRSTPASLSRLLDVVVFCNYLYRQLQIRYRKWVCYGDSSSSQTSAWVSSFCVILKSKRGWGTRCQCNLPKPLLSVRAGPYYFPSRQEDICRAYRFYPFSHLSVLSRAPTTGLEPVTSWLTVKRSTNWTMREYLIYLSFFI